MSIEFIAWLVPIVLAVFLCLLLLMLNSEIKRQKQPYSTSKRGKFTKTKAKVKLRAFSYSLQQILLSPISLFVWIFYTKRPSPIYLTPLQEQLLGMVHQDWDLANRLVDYERKNLGRSEDWYWQAAIERLIKDRR